MILMTMQKKLQDTIKDAKMGVIVPQFMQAPPKEKKEKKLR